MRVIAASFVAIGLTFSAASAEETISKSASSAVPAAGMITSAIQQAHRNVGSRVERGVEQDAGRGDRKLSRQEFRLALIALLRESKLLKTLAQ